MPTPVRKQYMEIKARYPEALLLFRMGDFYETFDEDARIAARDLEIVLTQRDMGQGEIVPLAGIPYHALDSYLGRLLRKGHRVAICEQTSVPDGRTLVDRAVVRVVTPGTIMEPGLLEAGANNYLAAVAVHPSSSAGPVTSSGRAEGAGAGQSLEAGIAYVDITTGEFGVTQIGIAGVGAELARLAASEVVISRDAAGLAESLSAERNGAHGYTVTPFGPAAFASAAARRRLLEHFNAGTLDAFGCEHLPLAIAAAGAVLEYLGETHRAVLPLLTGLRTYSTESFMALDAQTRRNLELFEGGRWGAKEHSLLNVLDLTETPMGARLLRRWLGQPLLDLGELLRRQEAVGWLHESTVRRQRFQAALKDISDMERALNRIGAGVAIPREVVALRRSLEQVPALKALLAPGDETDEGASSEAVGWLDAELSPCLETVSLIATAIADEPQGDVGQGRVVRQGFSIEMDDLRDASQNARSYIAGLERRERERTGIGNLKVGYNKVFGYYLEITKSNLTQVPDDYVRRQTLVNAERFFTLELKEYEDKVLHAGERMEELESALYRQVCRQIADAAPAITRTAQALAVLDVFVSLAEAAVRYHYVRPTLSGPSVHPSTGSGRTDGTASVASSEALPSVGSKEALPSVMSSEALPSVISTGGLSSAEGWSGETSREAPAVPSGPRTLYIKTGRHPVVERSLPSGTFVPNDTLLSTDAEQLIILTGPNMAGKSTYLRQVALITLMAQVGSFVPAGEAHVGLVDRIFTRVGLQDDLAAGQSTFMVEMVETATITNLATSRSLVILDEIGRGTSTYDGLAIAQSVVEYIHNHPRLGCRTLFATHYHELTELAKRLPRVRNYCVAVSDEGGDVVFLHRILPGAADKSYGIHVAQMAG
ncbi:MAG: DNA mismatch repair protein MutS, partial [Dehalococcoidia bacterium]